MNQYRISRRNALALGGSAALASGFGAAHAEGGVRFVTANNSGYDTLDPHTVFDIGRIGQVKPGQSVRFRAVDVAEAHRLRGAWQSSVIATKGDPA